MRKIIITVLLVFFFTSCTRSSDVPNQDNINLGNSDGHVSENYEFSHGFVNYQFETLNYDGEPLELEYFIENMGKECELGLVVLVDGITQYFEVDGKQSNIYKNDFKKEQRRQFSIKLNPQAFDKKEANLNTYLVLNPSKKINNIKEYGNNHAISNNVTVRLNMNVTNNTKDIIKNPTINYESIPSDILESYTIKGMNMLESDIYVVVNGMVEQGNKIVDVNQPLNVNVFGKAGMYRLLTVIDNQIVETLNVMVKENQVAIVNVEPPLEKNNNLYFLVVPVDPQDQQNYTVIAQSERMIVQ